MSFLALPPEIRLYIYELSLADLIKKTPCPCVKDPLHRFATFLSLSLTCREIYSEITSLFNKAYKDQVYIYFDDAIKLYDFYQYASRRDCLKDLHFCLRFAEGLDYDEYGNGDLDGSHLRWDISWPNGENTMGVAASANRDLSCSQLGLRHMWHYYQDEVRPIFDSSNRLDSYIEFKGYRFEECYSGVRSISSGEAISCRSTHFPPTESGLHFSLHHGLYSIKELRGRLSDVTFRGVDMDELKSRIYHIRDSPWNTGYGWCYPSSPDLDADERSEMDAGSWGVLDRRSSEATEDDFEERWQLNFGGEDEAAE